VKGANCQTTPSSPSDLSINFQFSSFLSIKEREAQPHSNLITLAFDRRFYAANNVAPA
jgi:hypothetical protein